jgi:DNA-binding transcriptional ArsR family regulator
MWSTTELLLGNSVPFDMKNPTTGEKNLTEDKIFELLSNGRRRELLRILKEIGGEVTLGDIISEMSTREDGVDAGAVKRKAVYVSLYQSHVPRLAEAGVVEYDGAKKTIRLTGPWRQLYPYLELGRSTRKQGLFSRMFRPQTGPKA